MRIPIYCRYLDWRPLAAAASVICITSGNIFADWRFEAESAAVYDSNLSNSDRSSDVKDDWSWQTNVRAANGFQLSRDLRLNLAADLSGQVWRKFYDFSNIKPGGSMGLRYRFGLGRTAPWLMLDDHLGYASFRDDPRSGWENELRVMAGIGITDRLSVETGYLFETFNAREAFWDWSGHNAILRMTFDLTSSVQLSVGYRYRNGDVISYALPPRPDLMALSSVRDVVDTFGFPQYTAYKLRGSTNAVSVSAAYALTKFISLEASYEYRNTSHDPLGYENHFFEAKVAIGY